VEFRIQESGSGIDHRGTSFFLFCPDPSDLRCGFSHSFHYTLLHATMTTLSTVRGHEALAVSTVFTSLATILVAIRIYTRMFMVKQMGADDYAILVALVRLYSISM
jgi:hypothetical protein